jgi:hypothetical protein
MERKMKRLATTQSRLHEAIQGQTYKSQHWERGLAIQHEKAIASFEILWSRQLRFLIKLLTSQIASALLHTPL